MLISYSFPGAKLTYRHQFDVSEDERQVLPVGVVLIDIVQEQDSTFVADVVMTLRSKTDDGFKVGEVSFTLPGVIDFHFLNFCSSTAPGGISGAFQTIVGYCPFRRTRHGDGYHENRCRKTFGHGYVHIAV